MMFAKRLLQRAVDHHHHHHHQPDIQQGNLKLSDCDLRVIAHYGVPSTASILAVDPIQQLIAIGTLDGRIKVIGGDNIEGLFLSPKQLPYKMLEFLRNQGFLFGISMDNEIQVWNLENQSIDSCLQWKSSITAFTVISGSNFMLVVDEHGQISILKWDVEDRKLLHMPYQISSKFLAEKAGFSFSVDQPIVGALPQPCSSGNRLLIAFENGLLILWDIINAQVDCIRGDKDLEMKAQVSDFPSKASVDSLDHAIQNLDEKEITALCWASTNGQVLAVGYIDGDIMLWDISNKISSKGHRSGPSINKVVRLQLSSAEKRLPVIVLHWAVSSPSGNGNDGQLFVYGGGEIGSEEVLTVVDLKWSSGTDGLKSVHRVDLPLTGSFSDMVFMSPATIGSADSRGLFVLTSPGNLQFYEEKILSSLASQQERSPSVTAIESSTVVPISEPQVTAAKLFWFPDGMDLSEIASAGSVLSSYEDKIWPLQGGVPSYAPSHKEKRTEGVYITGHQDGSIRICNASYPVLSLISIIDNKVNGLEIAGLSSPVSKLDMSVATMNLAVGNEHGLVRVYSLSNNAEKTNLHVITGSKVQVHEVPRGNGLQCVAVFDLVRSCIVSLHFSERGNKLAVGYESNNVAVLDINTLSILFVMDSISGSHSPVISVIWRSFMNSDGLATSQNLSGSGNPESAKEEVMFTLNRDGKVNIFDGNTGDNISSQPMRLKNELTAISIHVIESSYSAPAVSKDTQHELSDGAIVTGNEAIQDGPPSKTVGKELEHPYSSTGERLLDSLVLICCETALRLYQVKTVFQGEDKPIRKVKLPKPCRWTATFENDGAVCGLVLLYESGDLEFRSLPDLAVVAENSLMSILRWNFRPKMQKIISSTGNGLIIMVNGTELAFISLSSGKDYSRITKYSPCLHDMVLAAAADAAVASSLIQKREAGFAGTLGDIFKGLKKEKLSHETDHSTATQGATSHLDDMFSKAPDADKWTNAAEYGDVEELSIDDLEIDDPIPVSSTSSYQHASDGKGNIKVDSRTGTERERLFGGASADTKPRMRTAEEIKAKYRKAGSASEEAKLARNKLLERGEKLQKLSDKTDELRSGAEDFASMAHELARTMEARKKWPF